MRKSALIRTTSFLSRRSLGEGGFRNANPLGELPIMSIVNPTLAHFRHFSSLYTNEYRVSRYESFMQNKPNLLNAQINVSSVLTKDYENARLGRRGKNKPNLSRRSIWRSRIKPKLSRRSLWRSRIKPNLSRRSLWRSRIQNGHLCCSARAEISQGFRATVWGWPAVRRPQADYLIPAW